MKLISALALTLIVATSTQAATPLAVSGAWSRPAVAGTNGVGYLTVTNGGKADVLVKVESPVAARVEMHSSSMAGGVMSMQREDRVPVPAGGKAAFAPGGYHLMLIGLTKTLKAGDKVPATLTFASGAKLQTAFAVGTGAGPPAMGPMHH
jgi:copper(I)-binding protein